MRFSLERAFVRGAHYRLFAVAALIGLLSLAGGWLVAATDDNFQSLGDAIWWAFLRLTDPGYLGDDEGTFRRLVSTILTVLGYVVFLGALVAIMTQWLTSTMRRIEQGLTPVGLRDHILLLGWTSRTGSIVREILESEGRVRRFLRRRGARGLQIVVLADDVDSALAQELRERVGPRWNPRKITLRSGSPLRRDHLERAAFLDASAILVPAATYGPSGPDFVDTHTIKTLLSLGNHPAAAQSSTLPLVVAELFDARKVPVTLRAYRGPVELLPTDAMISRVIAQNLRHRGLSAVYRELLSHGRGNTIYVRELPDLSGSRLQDVVELFPGAIPLGVVRPNGAGAVPVLNPGDGFTIEPGDRLVFVARSYEDAEPAPGSTVRPQVRGRPPEEDSEPAAKRRLLLLGWSHKVPALVAELGTYGDASFEITILSSVPADERRAALERYLGGTAAPVDHVEGDLTLLSDVSGVDPAAFENVVLLASDWLESGEASDARTIVGYLLLQEVLARTSGRPQILVELMDPDNEPLLGERAGEVIISTALLSHMVAQIALRRELRAAFDELFSAGGAEICFRSSARYRLPGSEVTFPQIQRAAAERGETALGLRRRRAGVEGSVALNPSRAETWRLEADLDVVTIVTQRG